MIRMPLDRCVCRRCGYATDWRLSPALAGLSDDTWCIPFSWSYVNVTTEPMLGLSARPHTAKFEMTDAERQKTTQYLVCPTCIEKLRKKIAALFLPPSVVIEIHKRPAKRPKKAA